MQIPCSFVMPHVNLLYLCNLITHTYSVSIAFPLGTIGTPVLRDASINADTHPTSDAYE